jgi:glycosyltransferase involved in cell wall biosynthesis
MDNNKYNKNISLSIVVPVFNTSLYLRRCIDSILNNKSEKIELILVNDGSTDGSDNILNEYARLDNRVKVFHKKNGGLSSARNAGLKLCSGEYVGFIDSDDYISPAYLKEFFRSLKFFKSDIFIGGRFVDNDGNIHCEFNLPSGHMSKWDTLNKILLWDNVDGSVCDKIFKKSLFDKIEFQKDVYSEDVPVTIKLIQMSENIYHFGTEIYYYFKRKGSITSNFFSNKMISVLFSNRDVYDTINKQFVDRKRIDFYMIWHLSRFFVRYFKLSGSSRIELKKNISLFLFDISLKRIWANEYLLFRDKLLMSIAKLIF